MDTANVKVGKNVDINDSETKKPDQELCSLNYANVSDNTSVGSDAVVVTPSEHAPSFVSTPSSSSEEVVVSSVLAPPDGGWGWVVVFASFMISLIADGVSLSFGILFVDLVSYFGGSKAKTSWVGSIFFSMPLLAGPVASYLSDRYGCRKVCIAGALLSCGAFVISMFATSLEVLFVTFTIAGLGLALCYVTSVVIVAYYFEKKRSLATGIATCGTGVGTFIFPPLTIYLLEEYAWHGTLLILSGFFLHIVVAGALMRDIEPNTSESKSDVNDSGSENYTVEESERLCSSLVQLPTYLHDDMPVEVLSEISNKEGGYLSSLLQQHPYLLNSITKKKSPSRESPCNVKVISGSKRKAKLKWESVSTKPENKQSHLHRNSSISKLDTGYLNNMRLQRGSITYRGAMLNIRRYRLRASSCPNIYRNSMVTIEEGKTCLCFKDLKDLLLSIFDFTMFKNLQYTLFCISNFLLYACVDVPYVYIPDHASNQNINMESASYLISILGVLNTLGVVIVGYIGDKPWIDSSLLYSGFIAISGLMLSIIPWVTDYYGLATLCGIYGFTISANYTLIPIIIVDLISLDSFTGAYGLLLLGQGVASLVGPPAAGMLFDLTGDYNITFFCTGIVIIVSGIMVAVIPAGNFFACEKSVLSSVGNSKESVKHDGPMGATVKDSQDPGSILYKNHPKVCNLYLLNKSFEDAKEDENSVTVPFLSVANNNNTKNVVDSSIRVCKSGVDSISVYENPMSNI